MQQNEANAEDGKFNMKIREIKKNVPERYSRAKSRER